MDTTRLVLVTVAAVSLVLLSCRLGQLIVPTVIPTITITPSPTHTQIPTNTPTATSVPATATPMPYIIPAGIFLLDTTSSCGTETSITAIDGNGAATKGGTISMRNGAWVLWCPGAKHTWIGTLIYNGYTLASDENTPLQFMVNDNLEYQYIGGKGIVTQPDGKIIVLPLSSSGETSAGQQSTLDPIDLAGIWKSDNLHAPDNSWNIPYSVYFQFANTKQYVYHGVDTFNSNRPTDVSDIVYVNINDSTFIKKLVNIPDHPEALGKFQKWTWRFENGNVLFTVYGLMDSQELALSDNTITALATGVKVEK
jgi:hypothetical protein